MPPAHPLGSCHTDTCWPLLHHPGRGVDAIDLDALGGERYRDPAGADAQFQGRAASGLGREKADDRAVVFPGVVPLVVPAADALAVLGGIVAPGAGCGVHATSVAPGGRRPHLYFRPWAVSEPGPRCSVRYGHAYWPVRGGAVRAGRLTALRVGHCDVTASISVDGIPVASKQGQLQLPVSLPVGAGIPLTAPARPG